MPRSPRNKYSRAAIRQRSRRRSSHRSSGWFWATLVVIVSVLGALLIFTVADSKSSNKAAAAPPQPPSNSNPAGDHWHTAFAINVCGEWLPNPPAFETAAGNSNVRVGIHTHGDGFIHIHPFVNSEGGSNATLGKFLKYGGWAASEDALKTWTGPSADPDKTDWSNGDRCPSASGEPDKGKEGRVVWDVDCKVQSGNPSDYKLKDQEVLAVGFLPKGDDLPAPPNAASAPSNDGTQPAPLDKAGCKPTAQNNPGVAPTTATTPAPTTATTASGTTATTGQ